MLNEVKSRFISGKKQTNLPAVGRKLILNKKTISNLQPPAMNKIIGGSTGCYGNTHSHWGCGNTKNCTQNQNTCVGHNTCNIC